MRQIEVINQETIIDVTAETSNVEILVRDYDSELVERFALEAQEAAIDAEESADIATAQASIATAQATIATTQAGIATTQAGIATTQASNALTSANEAAASAASAAQVGTSTPLTGFSTGANSTILATDTILQGFNKTQGQINARVAGTIATGQVAFGTAANTVGGDASLIWDNTNKRLGVGTSTPVQSIQTAGSISLGDRDVNTIRSIGFTAFNAFGGSSSQIGFVSQGASINGLDFRIAGAYGIRIFSGASELYRFDNIGRLGILTTSPTQSLDVNGTGRIRNGVSLADTSGNVQIGTTTDAGFRLDVNGTARVQGAGTFNSSITAGATIFGKGNAIFQNGTTNILNVGTDQLMYGGSNSDGGVFVYGNNKLFLSTNSVRRLTVDGGGNVAIGTTTDAGFRLDVNGTARVQGNLNVSTGGITLTGAQTIQTSTGALTLQPLGGATTGINLTNNVNIYSASNIGVIRNTVTNGSLRIAGGNSTSDGGNIGLGGSTGTNQVEVRIGASNHSIFAPSGNLLVGATTDGGARLQVQGTANFVTGVGIGAASSLNYINSGPILTTTLTSGGSGYVDGTYVDVVTTSVAATFGVYSLFTIVVSGGIVTTATLTWGGTAYRVGDTLTVSNTLLGGTGSGLVITVNTVDSSQLTIVGNNGGDITLYRNDVSIIAGENIGRIKWEARDASTKANGICAEIGAFAVGTNGSSQLSFFTTAGNLSSLTEGFRLTNLSNVLIGTTTDAGFRLDVNGTARVQSTLKVGAATATNSSSVLDLESTTLGFLPPRMTTTQRNAIASPATGLVVYDTTLNKLYVRTASSWEMVTSL
jgi:hypothetical protein